MRHITQKPIGIIGGMGPYASAYFYTLLLKKSGRYYSGIQANHEFPEIILDSIPVPYFLEDERELHIAKKMLLSRTLKLNRFGVSCIAMTCNTAHVLFPDLNNCSTAPFISMIQIVADSVSSMQIKRVGILATPTTIQTQIYGKVLELRGIQPIYANKTIQRQHVVIIKQTVAGQPNSEGIQNLVKSTQQFIIRENLDGLILACTELPLIFPKSAFKNIPIIDCLDVLADSLLLRYYHKEVI
jgi:aspartate racemase